MHQERVRLTKAFSFEMAHALEGYDGACKNLHGHSYHLWVTVRGVPISDIQHPKNGMAMDFGELKGLVGRLIIDRYDHALVLRESEQGRELQQQLASSQTKIELVPYQPTCENMVVDFAHTLRRELPTGVELLCIKLHETATSYAEWHIDDNPSM